VSEPLSDERRKAWLIALIEERRGYEQKGLTDRVAEVDEQLRLLGADHADRVHRRPKLKK
jgi:hypothetical protein